MSQDLLPFLRRLSPRQRLLLEILQESHGRLVVLRRLVVLFLLLAACVGFVRLSMISNIPMGLKLLIGVATAIISVSFGYVMEKGLVTWAMDWVWRCDLKPIPEEEREGP